MKYLASNLKFLRKSKKLTQDEMPGFVGVSRATWSNYENAISEPDLDTVIRIAKFFGITIDDLLLKNFNDGKNLKVEESEIRNEINQLKQEMAELKKLISAKGKDK